MAEAVIGLKKLRLKLKRLEEIDAVEPLTKAALLVEGDAIRNCPVDTGALRNSITHTVETHQATVGTNLEYAPFVEFGTGIFSSIGLGRQTPWSYQDSGGRWYTTSGQAAQPFLFPALELNKVKIRKIFKKTIKETLKD